MLARSTSIRIFLTVLVFMMANAVLFGIGMVTVLANPALTAYQEWLIPIVIFLSVMLAVPLSWFIAPRLRAHYWREHPADLISGPKYSPPERL
ncbi:MAG: hypothetical protein EPO23_03725 [Xanthobacteraceae bacterium]|nr:MAG: hypothetical protein EPO23_03725 [Xanthobacteraceae bacterium]